MGARAPIRRHGSSVKYTPRAESRIPSGDIVFSGDVRIESAAVSQGSIKLDYREEVPRHGVHSASCRIDSLESPRYYVHPTTNRGAPEAVYYLHTVEVTFDDYREYLSERRLKRVEKETGIRRT